MSEQYKRWRIAGIILVMLAILWAICISALNARPARIDASKDVIPEVVLNQQAQTFVSSLPVFDDATGSLAMPPAAETSASDDFTGETTLPDDSADETAGGATSEPPLPPAILDTVPRMIIPKLGVDEIIVELPTSPIGWSVENMETYIGHLEGTDAPGGPGNAAFGGHVTLRDRSPGPLINLEQLEIGSQILIVVGQTTYVYQVTRQFTVNETRLDILDSTGTPTLTLITCARWSWISGRYRDRLVVVAELIDQIESPT